MEKMCRFKKTYIITLSLQDLSVGMQRARGSRRGGHHPREDAGVRSVFPGCWTGLSVRHAALSVG